MTPPVREAWHCELMVVTGACTELAQYGMSDDDTDDDTATQTLQCC